MKLKVVLPSGVFLEQEVVKVVAEAQNGAFCLLPRHIDFVASLIPGILALTSQDDEESFLAVDEGVLVKCGPEVLVSTWNAVRGPLGELRHAVREQFRELGEREQKARSALGKLEASMVRQILEWEDRGHA
ncbi:MAG: F0F1 ATP synthase subunit epsilon [Planctomycetes bacterium]|nr:F0F1 ATP synthase subunit epsilon [Planctomycetota bacterium]